MKEIAKKPHKPHTLHNSLFFNGLMCEKMREKCVRNM